MSDYLDFNYSTFKLTAKIQLNPIKEVGINGCQIDDIVTFIKEFITGLNREFPCRENSIVITKLEEAEMWLKRRKENREKREVEGYSLR